MNIALFLMAQLTSLACAIGAIILALNKVEGWGWLLFVAIITHVDWESD